MCRVDCINGLYSVETAAQRKDSPCNAIAQTNIVRLDGFFISKLYFLDTRQNARHQSNSYNVRNIKDTFGRERFSCMARDTT